MLTSYQVQTAAYQTEDGELLCESCFDEGEFFCRPVIRYELDEQETAMSVDWEPWVDDEEHHVYYCECCMPVWCDRCAGELTDGYVDSACADKQEG